MGTLIFISLFVSVLLINSVSLKLSYAQDANSFLGTVLDQLKPNGCRTGSPYIVSGKDQAGRANMSAAYGASLDIAVSAKGLFSGEDYFTQAQTRQKNATL
jgi:hypothetical protein